jgi:hypothetical protein
MNSTPERMAAKATCRQANSMPMESPSQGTSQVPAAEVGLFLEAVAH